VLVEVITVAVSEWCSQGCAQTLGKKVLKSGARFSLSLLRYWPYSWAS